MDFGKFLYLSRSEVAACGVTWDQAMDVAEKTYAEHAAGAYEMPPKPGVHPSACPGAFLHAMPGYLPGLDAVGLKWVAVFGHNRKKYGVNSLSSLMILNDPETGYPIAVMEAGLITSIRTATASGVSVRYLARKDAKVIGLIGAGEQGRNNMKLIKHVAPQIDTIKIFDLYPEFAQKLCDDLKEELGVDAYVAKDREEVFRGSDIIVTAAPVTVKEPVYKKEWIKEGALLLPVHSKGWEYECFSEASKFVADDWNQYSSDMFNKEKGYYKDREPFALYSEIGKIVTGEKPGRENDGEIIASANMGIALQDISLGKEILRIAKEKGLGTELSLE